MTPLSHLRLLDLSRQLPGPFCSTLLADLGMDVLVVTAPDDPFATGIPFLARNKRSMTLNLKCDEGRDVFRQLSRSADVVLEGFRPGVAARLGIDYPTLAAASPRLIYCAISGYGQDGPYRDRVGHDVNYLAQAGVLGYVGSVGGPPVIPGVQIADIGGGALMAAVGILTAVIARERTGRGQMIDVAMLDGAVSWNVYHQLLQMLGGTAPVRGGEQLTGGYACYNVYETRDGRWISIGAYEPHFWTALCRAVGRADMIPHQWADGEMRESMLAAFRDIIRREPLAEWERRLGTLDICFAPVATLDEVAANPQVQHRDMLPTMETALGPMRMPGVPIKLSDTPGALRTPPPTLGADTDAVLHGIGLAVADVARLRAAGVV